MAKNILFILDELYPNTSANSRIVYRVIDQFLKKTDYNISILGRAVTEQQKAINNYNGCLVIHTPYNQTQRAESIKNKLNRYSNFLKYLFLPKYFKYLYKLKKQGLNIYEIECIDYINTTIKINKVDIIIACSMPFYTLHLAAKFAHKVPVLFYMLEPYSTFEKNADINKEIEIDNLAHKIFAPPLVLKEYKKTPLKVNIDKFIATEFPNIINKKINEFKEDFDKTKTHCFFIGKLYSKLRNPKFLFDIIEQLQNEDIVLHCVGGINEDFTEDFYNKYLKGKIPNIIYHGEVSPEKADWYASNADILINIGNMNQYLLPSKLIDYLATGKPIINISQINHCSTESYIKKYPLGISIFEDNLDLRTAQVLEFCKKNKGKSLSFNEVQKIYFKHTPEFVSGQFIEVINKISPNV